MNRRAFPYTSSDLRLLADQIEQVEKDIVGAGDLPDGHWAWGAYIEIEDDGGSPVGQIRAYGDGWLGFYPYAIEARDNA